jgi:formylglycine-generating enzyme
MSPRARNWTFALASLLLACSARTAPAPGQLLLYLDTDAPLPTGSSVTEDVLTPAPLFDRVRFDVVKGASACASDCSREFDVTEALVMSGGASFGVLAPLVGDATLRVRLFRASAVVEGEPDPGSTVDRTFALPEPPSVGVAAYTLFMPTEDAGVPDGTVTPIAPEPGRPNPAHAGTWAGATRTPCASPAREGEVCIPGGAFWMGNLSVPNCGPGSGSVSRLVVLSPYFMDATEVTVGAFRQGGGQSTVTATGTSGCEIVDYCTYTPSPGPNESLPVNCVDWQEARSYCQNQGKDLPTEAEFEYAAGGLASQPYVWGTDVPSCGQAVFARGGYGAFGGTVSICSEVAAGQECSGAPPGGVGLGGPLPPRSGTLDRLVVDLPGEGGTIYDLAGNVTEFARDHWDLETGPCWSRPGVYDDPVCDDPSSTDVPVRGGAWSFAASELLAARRSGATDDAIDPEYGFRCVRE